MNIIFYSVDVFRSRTLYKYNKCTSTYLYNVLGNHGSMWFDCKEYWLFDVVCNILIAYDAHMCLATHIRNEILICWLLTYMRISMSSIFFLLLWLFYNETNIKLHKLKQYLRVRICDDTFNLLFIPKCKDVSQYICIYLVAYSLFYWETGGVWMARNCAIVLKFLPH